MKTSELNEKQLMEYFSEHVRYEIQMLLNATEAISKQQLIANGLEYMPVESFAIHLRNLITFLYPNAQRDDDVCAKDFFATIGKWEQIRPMLAKILESAKIRADKEVGHLTTSRLAGTPAAKIWDVNGLSREIMPILKLFCDSSDKVKLDVPFNPVWGHYTKIMAPPSI